MDLRKTVVATACISLFLTFAGCGAGPARKAPKPSEDVIRTAIQDYLRRNVPDQFGEKYLGIGWPGVNGQLEQYEFIRMGDYNTDGKYWPVETSGNGQYDFLKGRRGKFQFRARFKIFKDDFGRWAAEFY